MTVGSLTGGEGWLQANPAAFEQAARALVATSGAIQQVINRRDAAIQVLTTDPSGWTGRASLQFTNVWARRREELLRQMVTQQDASIVYQRFAAALSEAQQAWQRLTEQAVQAGVGLTPEGSVDIPGLPAAAGLLALSDEVQAIRAQAEAITTQITDADRQAAAQLSELARRDPRPEVEDTTNLPVLLHAGMRGQIGDTALPPGTDPNVVAAWFAALSPQVQQQLVRTAPSLVGNLNGLPPAVRDQANRLAIRRALAGLPAEAAAARREQADVEGRRPLPADEQLREFGRLEAHIDDLEHQRAQTYRDLLALDDGYQILAFSPERNGQVAIAVGDITTASNIGVLVPGMDTTINKFHGYLQGASDLRLAVDGLSGPDGTQGTAMVAWLGYDAPQGFIETLNTRHLQATAGAPRLAEFTEGLMTTHQGDPHLTIVGHSYGSSTMSLAAMEYGLPADKLVFMGSTGALEAGHADQLKQHLADGAEVWAGRNKNDVAGDVPEHILGIDPVQKEFGAGIFQADDEVTILKDWAHGSNLYLNPDPNASPSFLNIARIVADRSEEVELGVHRFLYGVQE